MRSSSKASTSITSRTAHIKHHCWDHCWLFQVLGLGSGRLFSCSTINWKLATPSRKQHISSTFMDHALLHSTTSATARWRDSYTAIFFLYNSSYVTTAWTNFSTFACPSGSWRRLSRLCIGMWGRNGPNRLAIQGRATGSILNTCFWMFSHTNTHHAAVELARARHVECNLKKS